MILSFNIAYEVCCFFFFSSSDLSLTEVILGFQIRNIDQKFTKSIFVHNFGWKTYHQSEI